MDKKIFRFSEVLSLYKFNLYTNVHFGKFWISQKLTFRNGRKFT